MELGWTLEGKLDLQQGRESSRVEIIIGSFMPLVWGISSDTELLLTIIARSKST